MDRNPGGHRQISLGETMRRKLDQEIHLRREMESAMAEMEAKCRKRTRPLAEEPPQPARRASRPPPPLQRPGF